MGTPGGFPRFAGGRLEVQVSMQVSMKTVPEAPGIYGRPFPRSLVSTPNGHGHSTADAPNAGKSAGTGRGLTLIMARGPPSTFSGHANTSRVYLQSTQDAQTRQRKGQERIGLLAASHSKNWTSKNVIITKKGNTYVNWLENAFAT